MFNQLVLFPTSGHLKINIGADATLDMNLSESECEQLRALCLAFYRSRCEGIAKQVATGGPALPPPDAEYTEVEDDTLF